MMFAASGFRVLGLCLTSAGFGEIVCMTCLIICPEVSAIRVTLKTGVTRTSCTAFSGVTDLRQV